MTGRAALALTLALTGCMADVGEGDELTDNPFVSPVNPYILANGMQQKDILGNSIVAQPERLKKLIENPLRDETFQPGVGPDELALMPGTQENLIFIRDLVECALDAKDFVKFQGISYQGAMGLAPKWRGDKPNREDLEVVSSCMLALNNNKGVSVILAQHGNNVFDEALEIDGPVRAYAYASDPVATPLPSFFQDCSPLQVGANRNCGWPEDDAWVGTCTPGLTVNVGAGAKVLDCLHPLGASLGNTVMRACEGKRGCDSGSANHLVSNDNTCGLNPAVKFTCPSSGTFSIMLGSSLPTVGYRAIAKAKGAKFVVRGPALFDVREGAFYGNILDPEALNPNFVILPGENDRGPIFRIRKGDGRHTGLGDPEIYLYEDAWACHDPNWDDGDAYMHARNCALANVQDESGSPVQANLCVARPLGECSKIGNISDDPAALCPIYDSHVSLGDEDYDECLDGNGNTRRFPVTTFLDEPCDLVSPPQDGNGKPDGGKKNLCARK